MIVTAEQLKPFRGRLTMVSGGFDPLHAGHIEYFREAAVLGLPVLCNISPDELVMRKHPPLLLHAERAQVIDAVRYVDLTHPSTSATTVDLEQIRPRYFVKGADWRGRLPREEVEACARHGIEIVYLDTVLRSSSEILRRFADSAVAARRAP